MLLRKQEKISNIQKKMETYFTLNIFSHIFIEDLILFEKIVLSNNAITAFFSHQISITFCWINSDYIFF